MEGACSLLINGCLLFHEKIKKNPYLHRVFILTGEWVDGPLLDALLALRQALVPA